MTPRTFLAEAEWRAQAAAHEARVRAWTDPHQERAARGERHPVHDFLFAYYAHRPAWLRRWHPGPDVALLGPSAREFLRHPGYRELPGPGGAPAVAVDPATLSPSRREFVAWLEALLRGMQARPAFFGCHGLHEWAMVYRQDPAEVRHQAWPLRLPAAEIARVVETGGVTCSHFDAFRFFTPTARPRNRLQPTRDDVPALEQRGCLHANMDLYKWAAKLAPFSPSELVADCHAFAREIRTVDMRASPYDCTSLGLEPIPVETPDGRAEYERLQRGFAAAGQPLRARLRALVGRLRAAVRGCAVPAPA